MLQKVLRRTSHLIEKKGFVLISLVPRMPCGITRPPIAEDNGDGVPM
jgi:hypothetical protein